MEINSLMVGDYIYKPNPRDHTQMAIGQVEPEDLYYGRIVYFEPIKITKEILEKNGFNKDAFTNLSPDYYYHDNSCSCCINLNSTCDKSKSIFVENTNTRISASIEESRHSFPKKPLYVHQLQHLFRLCEIYKEIEL